MTLASLLAHRAARSRGILIALSVTIAVAVALAAGLWAATTLGAREAIRETFADDSTDASWLQIQTRPADDPDAQRSAGVDVLTDLLGEDALVSPGSTGAAGSDFERTTWRVEVAPAALTPAGIARLDAAVLRALETIRDSEAARGGAVATGTLPATLAESAASARASAAIAPVPVAVLAALALFAVFQLARLLGVSRAEETRLLDARGFSPGQRATAAAAEGVAVALVGSLVGAGVVVGALAATRGQDAAAVFAPDALPIAGTIALAAALAAATVAVASRGAVPAETARPSRLRRVALAAVTVLAVGLTAVLTWQAVATRGGTGDGWVLVVTVLAPTVGVAAVGLVALAAFGPLAALVARVAGRGRGVSLALPARQVARRTTAPAVAVALVAIAVGGAALAAAYSGTWSSTASRTAALDAGAAARAAADPVPPATVAELVDAGVDAAAAYEAAIVIGETSARLVAVPEASVAGVVADGVDAAETTALAEALRNDLAGVPIPDAADGVVVTGRMVGAADARAAVALTAWVVDAAGTPASIPLALTVDGDAFRAEGALPAGRAPFALVSVDAARGAAFSFDQVAFEGVEIAGLAAGAAESLPTGILASAIIAAPTGPTPTPGTVVLFAASSATGQVTPARAPVVATTALADTLGLAVGDPIDARVDGTGREFAFELAAIRPALPGIGAGAGLVADLDALVVSSVRAQATDAFVTPPLATHVWAGPEAPTVSGADVPWTTPADPTGSGAAAPARAWVLAAIGGAALAGVALVALVWSSARRRTDEAFVLRALGLAPARTRRLQAGEWVVVLAAALALGAALGLALSAALVPGLVARTIAGAPAAPPLSLDPVPLVAATAVLVGALALGLAGTRRAARRGRASARGTEAS